MQEFKTNKPRLVEKWLEETRTLSTGVFGTNFIPSEIFHPDLSDVLESVEIASKIARVVEFFFRKPDPKLVELVHKGGALAFCRSDQRRKQSKPPTRAAM